MTDHSGDKTRALPRCYDCVHAQHIPSTFANYCGKNNPRWWQFWRWIFPRPMLKIFEHRICENFTPKASHEND